MNIIRRNMSGFYFGLLELIFATSAFAADQTAPEPYPCGMGYGMHGHSFWWIFPLVFFILMIAMAGFMMRKCGRGCMCHGWMREGSDMKQQSDSALEILNKRYARGEIDKPEYEEKKAAINISK